MDDGNFWKTFESKLKRPTKPFYFFRYLNSILKIAIKRYLNVIEIGVETL